MALLLALSLLCSYICFTSAQDTTELCLSSITHNSLTLTSGEFDEFKCVIQPQLDATALSPEQVSDTGLSPTCESGECTLTFSDLADNTAHTIQCLLSGTSDVTVISGTTLPTRIPEFSLTASTAATWATVEKADGATEGTLACTSVLPGSPVPSTPEFLRFNSHCTVSQPCQVTVLYLVPDTQYSIYCRFYDLSGNTSPVMELSNLRTTTLPSDTPTISGAASYISIPLSLVEVTSSDVVVSTPADLTIVKLSCIFANTPPPTSTILNQGTSAECEASSSCTVTLRSTKITSLVSNLRAIHCVGQTLPDLQLDTSCCRGNTQVGIVRSVTPHQVTFDNVVVDHNLRMISMEVVTPVEGDLYCVIVPGDVPPTPSNVINWAERRTAAGGIVHCAGPDLGSEETESICPATFNWALLNQPNMNAFCLLANANTGQVNEGGTHQIAHIPSSPFVLSLLHPTIVQFDMRTDMRLSIVTIHANVIPQRFECLVASASGPLTELDFAGSTSTEMLCDGYTLCQSDVTVPAHTFVTRPYPVIGCVFNNVVPILEVEFDIESAERVEFDGASGILFTEPVDSIGNTPEIEVTAIVNTPGTLYCLMQDASTPQLTRSQLKYAPPSMDFLKSFGTSGVCTLQVSTDDAFTENYNCSITLSPKFQYFDSNYEAVCVVIDDNNNVIAAGGRSVPLVDQIPSVVDTAVVGIADGWYINSGVSDRWLEVKLWTVAVEPFVALKCAVFGSLEDTPDADDLAEEIIDRAPTQVLCGITGSLNCSIIVAVSSTAACVEGNCRVGCVLTDQRGNVGAPIISQALSFPVITSSPRISIVHTPDNPDDQQQQQQLPKYTVLSTTNSITVTTTFDAPALLGCMASDVAVCSLSGGFKTGCSANEPCSVVVQELQFNSEHTIQCCVFNILGDTVNDLSELFTNIEASTLAYPLLSVVPDSIVFSETNVVMAATFGREPGKLFCTSRKVETQGTADVAARLTVEDVLSSDYFVSHTFCGVGQQCTVHLQHSLFNFNADDDPKDYLYSIYCFGVAASQSLASVGDSPLAVEFSVKHPALLYLESRPFVELFDSYLSYPFRVVSRGDNHAEITSVVWGLDEVNVICITDLCGQPEDEAQVSQANRISKGCHPLQDCTFEIPFTSLCQQQDQENQPLYGTVYCTTHTESNFLVPNHTVSITKVVLPIDLVVSEFVDSSDKIPLATSNTNGLVDATISATLKNLTLLDTKLVCYLDPSGADWNLVQIQACYLRQKESCHRGSPGVIPYTASCTAGTCSTFVDPTYLAVGAYSVSCALTRVQGAVWSTTVQHSTIIVTSPAPGKVVEPTIPPQLAQIGTQQVQIQTLVHGSTQLTCLSGSPPPDRLQIAESGATTTCPEWPETCSLMVAAPFGATTYSVACILTPLNDAQLTTNDVYVVSVVTPSETVSRQGAPMANITLSNPSSYSILVSASLSTSSNLYCVAQIGETIPEETVIERGGVLLAGTKNKQIGATQRCFSNCQVELEGVWITRDQFYVVYCSTPAGGVWTSTPFKVPDFLASPRSDFFRTPTLTVITDSVITMTYSATTVNTFKCTLLSSVIAAGNEPRQERSCNAYMECDFTFEGLMPGTEYTMECLSLSGLVGRFVTLVGSTSCNTGDLTWVTQPGLAGTGVDEIRITTILSQPSDLYCLPAPAEDDGDVTVDMIKADGTSRQCPGTQPCTLAIFSLVGNTRYEVYCIASKLGDSTVIQPSPAFFVATTDAPEVSLGDDDQDDIDEDDETDTLAFLQDPYNEIQFATRVDINVRSSQFATLHCIPLLTPVDATITNDLIVEDGQSRTCLPSILCTLDVIGLEAASTYEIYCLLQNRVAGAIDRAPVVVVSTADDVAPLWVVTPTQKSPLSEREAVILASVDENVELYCVVLATVPSSAAAIVQLGVGPISCSASEVCELTIPNLEPNTRSNAYCTARDTSGNHATVVHVDISTDLDNPPGWLSDTLGISGITSNAFKVTVELSDQGALYCVAIPQDTAQPSSDPNVETIRVTGVANLFCQQANPCTVTLSNLQEESEYKVYCFIQDSSRNVNPEIKQILVVTSAVDTDDSDGTVDHDDTEIVFGPIGDNFSVTWGNDVPLGVSELSSSSFSVRAAVTSGNGYLFCVGSYTVDPNVVPTVLQLLQHDKDLFGSSSTFSSFSERCGSSTGSECAVMFSRVTSSTQYTVWCGIGNTIPEAPQLNPTVRKITAITFPPVPFVKPTSNSVVFEVTFTNPNLVQAPELSITCIVKTAPTPISKEEIRAAGLVTDCTVGAVCAAEVPNLDLSDTDVFVGYCVVTDQWVQRMSSHPFRLTADATSPLDDLVAPAWLDGPRLAENGATGTSFLIVGTSNKPATMRCLSRLAQPVHPIIPQEDPTSPIKSDNDTSSDIDADADLDADDVNPTVIHPVEQDITFEQVVTGGLFVECGAGTSCSIEWDLLQPATYYNTYCVLIGENEPNTQIRKVRSFTPATISTEPATALDSTVSCDQNQVLVGSVFFCYIVMKSSPTELSETSVGDVLVWSTNTNVAAIMPLYDPELKLTRWVFAVEAAQSGTASINVALAGLDIGTTPIQVQVTQVRPVCAIDEDCGGCSTCRLADQQCVALLDCDAVDATCADSAKSITVTAPQECPNVPKLTQLAFITSNTVMYESARVVTTIHSLDDVAFAGAPLVMFRGIIFSVGGSNNRVTSATIADFCNAQLELQAGATMTIDDVLILTTARTTTQPEACITGGLLANNGEIKIIGGATLVLNVPYSSENGALLVQNGATVQFNEGSAFADIFVDGIALFGSGVHRFNASVEGSGTARFRGWALTNGGEKIRSLRTTFAAHPAAASKVQRQQTGGFTGFTITEGQAGLVGCGEWGAAEFHPNSVLDIDYSCEQQRAFRGDVRLDNTVLAFRNLFVSTASSVAAVSIQGSLTVSEQAISVATATFDRALVDTDLGMTFKLITFNTLRNANTGTPLGAASLTDVHGRTGVYELELTLGTNEIMGTLRPASAPRNPVVGGSPTQGVVGSNPVIGGTADNVFGPSSFAPAIFAGGGGGDEGGGGNGGVIAGVVVGVTVCILLMCCVVLILWARSRNADQPKMADGSMLQQYQPHTKGGMEDYQAYGTMHGEGEGYYDEEENYDYFKDDDFSKGPVSTGGGEYPSQVPTPVPTPRPWENESVCIPMEPDDDILDGRWERERLRVVPETDVDGPLDFEEREGARYSARSERSHRDHRDRDRDHRDRDREDQYRLDDSIREA